MVPKYAIATAMSLAPLIASRVVDPSLLSINASRALIQELDSHNVSFGFVNASRFPERLPKVAGLDFDPAKYANDDMWKQYVHIKGQHLVCLMQATDKGAGFLEEDRRTPPSAASPWSGDLKNELKTWFWHNGAYEKGWECDWERLGLKTAFTALGLNARPAFDDDGDPADGHNDCLSITHYNEEDVEDPEDPEDEWPDMKDVKKQKYNVGNKEYTATGAYYDFAVNKIDGAIIGKNLNSPAVSVVDFHNWGRKAAPEELPDLRFCSNIYWAHWVRDNPNIKNFRVYGAHRVVNDATVLLIARAFKNKGVTALAPWPGTSFLANTEEGKALIGSPIGATIAHMLIQHKSELGIKHISRVTVVTGELEERPSFGEQPRRDVHLFFEIEDVPVQEITDDSPEEQKASPRKMAKRYFESKVLYVRNAGRDILREHMLQM